MNSAPFFVILNPHADRGRCARLLDPLRAIIRRSGRAEIFLTKAAGDEIRLTREAIAAGFKTIIAVGGDGTWNGVGGEIFRSGADVRLGLIPGGTGSDLARTLGLPDKDPAKCFRIVEEGRTLTIDVGLVEGRTFLNIAGFGFDTAVLEDSRQTHFLRGSLVYLYCALRQIRSFRGFSLRISADGEDLGERSVLMVIIANARHFGGFFRIAPMADPADGLLDAVLFENVGPLRRLALMKRLISGTHGRCREVAMVRARAFRLDFGEAPRYEVDGEWHRARNKEVEIAVAPGALKVFVPASTRKTS
jgi:diacylglycerol kinase (ATP)